MSRIGGAFPFPVAQVGEGGQVITLPPGGIFYFPPGQYLAQVGGVSNLQFFDPILQAWRNTDAPACDAQYINADGYNYRACNMSGITVGAAITAAGSGGTNGIGATATGATVVFGAPAAGGALATATGYPIVGGSVAAPTITQAGSGFLVPPLIVIDPPPLGGVQATAVATISAAGALTGVTMVNVGAGYAATPTFWIIPQFGSYAGGASGSFAAGASPAPGLVFPANAIAGNQNTSPTGAQLTSVALTGSGTLTGIVVSTYGFGYTGTTIPSVTIAGGGLVGATATAIMSMSLLSITLGNAGAGFGAGNPPMWETSLGLVAASSNNNYFQPRAARGVTTVSAGGVATFVIEDSGFGFQKVPLVSVLNTSAIASTQATGTAVVGGMNDFCVFQPRVQ